LIRMGSAVGLRGRGDAGRMSRYLDVWPRSQ